MSQRSDQTLVPIDAAYESLLQLGYPAFRIAREYAISPGSRADLVVLDTAGKPFIILEVKQTVPLLNAENPETLRFDPAVRSLQALARTARAPIYVLTDGEVYFWFETDLSGRPARLPAPLPAQSRQAGTGYPASLPTTRGEVARAFDAVRQFLLGSGRDAAGSEAAAIIIAKTLSERRGGDPEINSDIWSESFSLIAPQHVVTDSDIRRLRSAARLLTGVELLASTPRDVLGALDEVFLTPQARTGDVWLPRWLSDFMARLGAPGAGSRVLDPACGLGSILAAVQLYIRTIADDDNGSVRDSPATETWGIARSIQDAMWTRVQNILLGSSPDWVFVGEAEVADEPERLPSDVLQPTHVITAPRFGRISTTYQRKPHFRYMEDWYLTTAVLWAKERAVVLVPDGLLLSSDRKNIRDFIRHQSNLEAVISLREGSLLPMAAVRTSILILGKRRSPEQQSPIFFAELDEIPKGFPSGVDEAPAVKRLLDTYLNWVQESVPPTAAGSQLIAQEDIDWHNLTAARYRRTAVPSPAPYPMMPLSQLLQIAQRGASFRLAAEGEAKVIGPAAVRQLDLRYEAFGRANQSTIPVRAPVAAAGDVLLNNIGDHLGAAAVVDKASAGAYPSQHIWLLRPDPAQVSPEYLACALNSAHVRSQVERLATGTLIPSLTRGSLAELLIPVPDPERQRAIVSELSTLRSQVRSATSALEEAKLAFGRGLAALGEAAGTAEEIAE